MKQILPRIELLDPIINVFKRCFSKPQFPHFRRYVGGLITLENKTIEGIASVSTETLDQSSQNRFLTASPWSEEDVGKRYMTILRRVIGQQGISLIIDDTLSKKTGNHIEETQYHKDHASSGYVFGHQWVTALLHVNNLLLPLFPRLYSKNTSSKIEIAKNLIDDVASTLHVQQVILDSWYTATDIIKRCLKHHIQVVGCLKSNRNISPEPGTWIKLSALRKKLTSKNFTSLKIDDECYRVYEIIARLKHIGMVKVLFTQQWDEEHKKWSKTFFLLSTNTQHSPEKILRIYIQRWSIETFHRDIKQNLGCEAYQMRAKRGIIRHMILVTLAYAILKLWMLRKGVLWTIAQTIRYIRTRLFDELLIAIVEEPQLQRRWEIIGPFIRKSAKA